MPNVFSPTAAVLQGQQVEQGLSQAELEGMQLRERLALRKAAGKLGSQNYFAGYEGVPGAERPEALKEAYRTGNPEDVAKLEASYSEPFKIQRSIETAGKIEAAKDASRLDYNVNMMKQFLDSEGGQQANAFGREMAPEAMPASSMTEAPSNPAVGEPASVRLNPQLSATERSFEVGPTGPTFRLKKMSPFEQSIKLAEEADRKDTRALAKTKESREALQQAHQNVQQVETEIAGVQKAMQMRDIPWQEGQSKLQQLRQEREALAARRDTLAAGKTAPMQAPAAAAPTAPVLRGTAPAPKAPATPVMSQEPQFTEKEQAELDIANRKQKMTDANLEIKNARLGVEKVTKFLPSIKELHKLVTSQNIGHPELEAIPGAASALSLNRTNAQVKKLNEAIINMFAEPGQSQMMNTIVERQMQGAVVPGLFTEPQLNKINSTVLMSNVEHLRNFPTFLEKWQKAHHGELTGAADAWIDYTDHNPRYGFKKDARGNVTVFENKHVIAPETWQYLRDNKMVRSVGDKTFIKQKDGSWVQK